MGNEKAFTVAGAFEQAVIYWLVNSESMATKFIDALVPELFSSPQARLAVKIMVQYYKSKSHVLSDPALLDHAIWQLHTSGKISEADCIAMQDYLATILCSHHPPESSVRREFAEVVRAKLHHDAAIRAVDLASNMAPLTEIIEAIQKADSLLHEKLPETFHGNILSNFKNWSKVISEAASQDKLPTLIPEVDANLDGGLCRQTLGLIVGPTGGGKSKFLRQIACAAIAQGVNTAYVVLEDPPKTVFADIFATFSGLPRRVVLAKPDEAEPYLLDRCRKLGTSPGDLFLETFQSGITLGNCLFELEMKMKAIRFKPDLLVVDYLDKFTGVNNTIDNDYICGRDVTDALRNYAVEKKLYIWTASQSRRAANGYAKLDENDVAGSMHKARTADVVLTLNLRPSESGGQEVRVWFAKNRNSGAGVGTAWTMPMYNWGHVLPTSAFPPLSASDISSEAIRAAIR